MAGKRKRENKDKKKNKKVKIDKGKASKKKGGVSYMMNPYDTIVPDEYYCKLTYYLERKVTCTAGGVQYYSIRLNSIHDPDFTGIGSSCKGVASLAALYSRYTVSGAEMDWTVTGADNTPARIGIIPASYSATPSTIYDLQGQARSKVIEGNCYVNSKNLNSYSSTAELWGVSKDTVQKEEYYSAGMGGSPTNVTYGHLLIQPTDQTSNGTYYLTCKITYYVKIWQRQNVIV